MAIFNSYLYVYQRVDDFPIKAYQQALEFRDFQANPRGIVPSYPFISRNISHYRCWKSPIASHKFLFKKKTYKNPI